MIAHVGLLFEHLATGHAFVAALHLVSKTLMPRQLGLLGKDFATHQALMFIQFLLFVENGGSVVY